MGTGFIDHCRVHFLPRRTYFSSKCNSHNTEYFAASQSLLSTKRTTASLAPHFLEENEILQFVLFINGIARTLQSCTFINHSLKLKVATFAEILKHICEKVNFSKVRRNFSNNKYLNRYFSRILLNLNK